MISDDRYRNSGKSVLITGANHEIGATTARAFAREGADLFLNYLRLTPEHFGDMSEAGSTDTGSPGKVFDFGQVAHSTDDVMKSIEDMGSRCHSMKTDLAQPGSIQALHGEAEGLFGKVDILVNNADADRLDTFLPSEIMEKEPHLLEEYPLPP